MRPSTPGRTTRHRAPPRRSDSSTTTAPDHDDVQHHHRPAGAGAAPARVTGRRALAPTRRPHPDPAGAAHRRLHGQLGARRRAAPARFVAHGLPGRPDSPPVALAPVRRLRRRDPRRGDGRARRCGRPVIGVFQKLYDARFPIRRMVLVDAYGGSDDASVVADNTSAFNCRAVTGGTLVGARVRQGDRHRPAREPVRVPRRPRVWTPRRRPTSIAPPTGRLIRAGDVVTGAFGAIGWGWGGNFKSFKDYQHFSASGRYVRRPFVGELVHLEGRRVLVPNCCPAPAALSLRKSVPPPTYSRYVRCSRSDAIPRSMVSVMSTACVAPANRRCTPCGRRSTARRRR